MWVEASVLVSIATWSAQKNQLLGRERWGKNRNQKHDRWSPKKWFNIATNPRAEDFRHVWFPEGTLLVYLCLAFQWCLLLQFYTMEKRGRDETWHLSKTSICAFFPLWVYVNIGVANNLVEELEKTKIVHFNLVIIIFCARKKSPMFLDKQTKNTGHIVSWWTDHVWCLAP